MWVSSNKLMSSEEYYASELSDDYLDAQADAGDYFLDESGFYLRLNSVKFPNLFRKVSFVSMRETTGERLSARSRESVQTEQRRPNSIVLASVTRL